jgi:hypothetical protein
MMNQLVRVSMFALSVAALAVTAQPARSAPPDACTLLTPADFTSIGAGAMTTAGALKSATTSSCRWEQQGVDASKAVSVIVSTKTTQAYEAGKGVRNPTPVGGVGDDAYLTGKSVGYMVLSLRKGQNAATVMVHGLKDVTATEDAEKALGKAAAGRLP